MITARPQETFLSSGNMVTTQAGISLTAEMYDLLSSKIYENKTAAVVRETICNARDIHKQVNSNSAIDVHLPTRLSPTFYVRDYGTSLTKDEVMSLYMTYGHSTKTKSNDSIGGFGIGSKSPLAYSDSFMVDTYLKGIQTSYSIYKKDGIPQVSKMFEQPTTEPTGLKVSVAIREGDYNAFAQELSNLMCTMEYPINLVGGKLQGELPKTIFKSPEYSIKDNFSGRVVAEMGGVAYKLSDKIVNTLSSLLVSNYKRTVVLHFNIGELSVAASRETLTEDDTTLANLAKKVEHVNKEAIKDLIKTCDELNNPCEVFALLSECNISGVRHTSLNNAGFKGTTMQMYLLDFLTFNFSVKTYNSYKSSSIYQTNLLNKTDASKIVFVISDKVMGGVKCAKAHARSTGKTVWLIKPDDFFENTVLSHYFGVDFSKLDKLSDLYETYFPKGSKTPREYYKTSGVFGFEKSRYNTTVYVEKEITELSKDYKGFYVEAVRNEAFICGKVSRFNDVKTLIGLGLFSEKEIIIVRNSAKSTLRKIKNAKLLTISDIENRITTRITTRSSKKNLKLSLNFRMLQTLLSGEGLVIKQHLKKAWELISHGYPLLRYTHDLVKSEGVSLVMERINYLGSVSNNSSSLFKDFNLKTTRASVAYKKEYDALTENEPMFKLLLGLSKWQVSEQALAQFEMSIINRK